MKGKRDEIVSFEENYANDRIILKDRIPLKLPLCVSLEASDICNFRCVMCHQGNPDFHLYKQANQNMELSLFQKCVRELTDWCGEVNQKIKLIKLYVLGEPLVNSNIVKMVHIIKEADICNEIEITSNASLLSDEIGKGLVDYGLDIFRASIYSVDPKRNEEITRSCFKPDVIRENIMKMRAYRDQQGKQKPFISAKMIDSYSKENELFFQKYKMVADEAYLDKIMDDSGNGELIKYYYKENCEKAFSDQKRTRITSERKSCKYPFTHMTIKSNGQVVVCCADWKLKTLVGDVNISGLQEIWNSKELYDFRCMTLLTKSQGNELCRNCEIPLRGYPEDDLDGVDIERFDYWR